MWIPPARALAAQVGFFIAHAYEISPCNFRKLEMTHLYDTVEPNVLSRELLRGCVLAQGPEGEAGRLAKEEGIEFSAVRHLRLDFQSECCSGGRG